MFRLFKRRRHIQIINKKKEYIKPDINTLFRVFNSNNCTKLEIMKEHKAIDFCHFSILDIISELSGTEKTERQQKEWRFLATLACKAAVKGGTKLDVEEQKRLVDNMITLDNPFNCPHGRPSIIHFSIYELEKMFKRSI